MDKKDLNGNNKNNDNKDLKQKNDINNNDSKNNNSNNNNKNDNQDNKNNQNKGKPPTQSPKQVYTFLFMALGFTIAFNFLMTSSFQNKNVQISYDTFISMVESDYVEEVEIQYDKLIIAPKVEELENITTDYFETDETESTTTSSEDLENNEEFMLAFGEFQRLKSQAPTEDTLFYTGRLPDETLHQLFKEHDVKYYIDVVNNNQLVTIITDWVLPMFLTYGILILVMVFITKKFKGDGGLGLGKSKAKLYVKEDCTGVTFDDVAGQDEAKESLTEIVDFLHNPEKYREIGARQPKGALLVGPPGTGKTLLAKAVAGESNAAFLSISGSEFIEMYVGVGATRVRDLFNEAKKNSPCIIFIDEIDAIGKSRDNQFGGNDEREQTLNQLLSELDGFDSRNAIVILAATNRPEILDKALLRPGRFDRQVIVERPDLKGRQDILNVHIKKVKYNTHVDLKKVALATTGLTGADLANIINEAALLAVREGRKEVEQKDLIKAVEIIVGGKEKKENHISVKERKLIAYHEIGHALTSALQENSTPIQRITIVPRTNGVLGFAWYTPEEEKVLKTKDEILTEIITSLGGRAAEIVGLGMETTGASNDIEHATANARTMVTMFGMSDTFKMMGIETVQSRYLGGRSSSNCSDITLADVDREVNKILDICFEKAKDLLIEYKQALIELSEALLDKENIDGKDFMIMLKKYKPDIVIEVEDPQLSIDDLYQIEKDKIEDLKKEGVSIEISKAIEFEQVEVLLEENNNKEQSNLIDNDNTK
ncbi:MAG: ATP-dependent zinc metalloprotease FtsH [Lachnospirales bacterium]